MNNEMTHNRLFGVYRGIVMENKDPKGKMRIRMRIPEVFDELITDWALPCVSPGVASVPEIGSVVWVEFEAGDPTRPVWVGTLGVAKPGHDID